MTSYEMASSLGPEILRQTWLCTLVTPHAPALKSPRQEEDSVGIQPKLHIVNPRPAWVMWQAVKKTKTK